MILKKVKVFFIASCTGILVPAYGSSVVPLEAIHEVCTAASACYYENGVWHHVSETAAGVDPWGPTGFAVGVAGIGVGLACAAFPFAYEWIAGKYGYGVGARLKRVEEEQIAQKDVLMDIGHSIEGNEDPLSRKPALRESIVGDLRDSFALLQQTQQEILDRLRALEEKPDGE